MSKKFLAVLVCGILALSVARISTAADLTVSKDKKVKLEYTLTVDGKVLETSQGKEPLQYVHGAGQLIKGLETALEGMKVGEQKNVTVSPKDAYGEAIPEAIKDFPKDKFPKEPPMQVGMVVELKGPDGTSLPGVITAINGDQITVNFNHPLAGKTLVFDVKVVGIE